MKQWHWIGIAIVVVLVATILYLRAGHKREPKYEHELSSQIDSLKKENNQMLKKQDSLSKENEQLKAQVNAAKVDADAASFIAKQKERENQSLINNNKKKRDENNKHIDNSTDDQLTKDILADYNPSKRCCD